MPAFLSKSGLTLAYRLACPFGAQGTLSGAWPKPCPAWQAQCAQTVAQLLAVGNSFIYCIQEYTYNCTLTEQYQAICVSQRVEVSE